MRLLDRYLFRELLTPLAYCLGGFLIFWISYDLFTELNEMQEHKLHLLDVIGYSIARTPEFLVMVLPIALLLALLYTLTNHARHNEITAMRAAGVSLWRLCVPYFIVGFITSLVLFALNEFCVPRSTEWAECILNRYVQNSNAPSARNQFRNFGFTNAREHRTRTWFIGEYHPETAEMSGPKVSWTLPNGSWRQLQAARAVRVNGVWVFFDVKEYAQVDTTAPLLPLFQTNVLAMPEFTEKPAEIEDEIKISSYLSLGGKFKADVPLADIWGYLRRHPGLPRTEASQLLTELHARLAAPWTCLVVVLIAIPFGTASSRRNLFVGVAGSIFICFGYFVIQKVSLALGSGGHLPAWLAAWLPNLAFGATGLLLTTRVR
ncbi:MAG: LptF/LptG family permease [Verrucomicrobiota bacterium]|jgi:lipopolysaccharide export system permease protein